MRRVFVLGSGVFSLVMLLLLATSVGAADIQKNNDRSSGRTIVYGTVWGQTLAQDGTGFYNEIFANLTAEESADVNYKLMPYRRARAQFLSGGSACLYPSARVVLESMERLEGYSFIETNALFMAQEHLFVPAGVAPPRGLADLKGKTVAVPTGSVMFRLLKDAGADLIAVHDETAKAQMLLTGRVDVMSGMLPNEYLIFEALGAPMASYDPGFALIDAGVAVVCHDTPETRAFVNRANAKIAQMIASESFRQRLSRVNGGPRVVGAADLNNLAPSAGSKVRYVYPGRRLPFSQIR